MCPLNETGEAVDWWFLYKVPKLSQSAGSAAAIGYEYAYYDSATRKIVQASSSLDTDHGALRVTLDALFADPNGSKGWILYNDERPEGADNDQLGHTKGVVGLDFATQTAFWLLHSWPKYFAPGAPGMPTPMYGQTFICVSLKMDDARLLAAQMVEYQQPQVYETRLPPDLPDADALVRLGRTVTPNNPAGSNTLSMSTVGGLPFKVIAKNRLWNRDFWNDLVGPTLGEDINVETWIRGKVPPTRDSDNIHVVVDIKFITLKPLGIPWAWPETRDHAKWAISHANGWVCVGDINRMVSQEKRGGCTIAFQDNSLWGFLSETDLLVVPTGWTTTDALLAIQSSHSWRGTSAREPTRSYFHDLLQTTAAGHSFEPAAEQVAAAASGSGQGLAPDPAFHGPARSSIAERLPGRPVQQMSFAEERAEPLGPPSFGAVVGKVADGPDLCSDEDGGESIRFTLEVARDICYQVIVEAPTGETDVILAHIADERLQPVGDLPSQPFGAPAYGVFANAALTYAGLGLKDGQFTLFDLSSIRTRLESSVNGSDFIVVYGQVSNEGSSNGKEIRQVRYSGRKNQDGAIAIYSRDLASGLPLRKWFFFKVNGSSVVS